MSGHFWTCVRIESIATSQCHKRVAKNHAISEEVNKDSNRCISVELVGYLNLKKSESFSGRQNDVLTRRGFTKLRSCGSGMKVGNSAQVFASYLQSTRSDSG